MSKTTHQAFNDIKKEINNLKKDISDSSPEWLYAIANFVHKYRITATTFYALSLYMIYIGEYPSAIITSIIGIYFSLRR